MNRAFKEILISALAVTVLISCFVLSERPFSATLGTNGEEPETLSPETVLPSEASPEETSPAEPPVSAPEPTEPTAGGDCICGRPYYTTDGEDHRQFDCVGCNHNNLSCTCGCWCGADSYSGISSVGQGILFCSKCDKTCSECTCADKETALRRESEIRNGILSVMGIAFPQNVFPVVFLILFLFGGAVFGSFCYLQTFGKTLPVQKKAPAKKKNRSSAVPAAPAKSDSSVPVKWKAAEKYPGLSLYISSMLAFTGRRASSSISLPLSNGRKYTLSEEDLSLLKKLSGLKGSSSPLRIRGRDGNPARLLDCGFVTENSGTVTITDRGSVYAQVMFEPEESFCVGSCSSPVCYICFYRGYGVALSEESEGLYTVLSDVKKENLGVFLREELAPVSNGENRIGMVSETFSYEEWLVLLSACAENSISFGIRSLARVEKAEFFKKVLSSIEKTDSFPSPDEVLDTENVLRNLSSLKEKGIVTGENGSYTLTTKGQSIAYPGMKDMVFFDRNSSDGIALTLLAVYRSAAETGDCVSAVCDTGSEIRLVTSGTIPWNRYIG